jgi:hypothetical protein
METGLEGKHQNLIPVSTIPTKRQWPLGKSKIGLKNTLNTIMSHDNHPLFPQVCGKLLYRHNSATPSFLDFYKEYSNDTFHLLY